MSLYGQYGVILCVAFLTFAFRYLPFMFQDKFNTFPGINYLERYLPASIMLILVIYTLKDTTIVHYPYGISEICSVSIVSLLHIKYRNALISIILGTIFYVILNNYVFL